MTTTTHLPYKQKLMALLSVALLILTPALTLLPNMALGDKPTDNNTLSIPEYISTGTPISPRNAMDKQLRIAAVDFTDNSRYSHTALATVAVQVGTTFDYQKLDDSIKEIYNTYKVEYVSTDLYEQADGTSVAIVYHIYDNPKVNSVTSTGNEKLKTKTLISKSTLKANKTYTRDLMNSTAMELNKYVASKKYSNYSLAYALEPNDGNFDINILVNEGFKAKIYNIDFPGNTVLDEAKLRSKLLSKEKSFWSKLSSTGILDYAKLGRDKQIITAEYARLGYLNVRVSEARITVDDEAKGVLRVSFDIDEGDVFYLGNLSITGNDDLFSSEELLDLIDLKEGKPIDASKLEDATQSIRNKFSDLGYILADVQFQFRGTENIAVLNIEFTINKGDKYYLNHLNVVGNTGTQDRIIRRQFDSIPEGNLINASNVQSGYINVIRTGYFSNVTYNYKNFTVNESTGKKYVDLEISLEESATGEFNLGLSFTTNGDFLIIGKLYKDNFWGRGYLVDTTVQLGFDDSTIDLSFTNPRVFDSKTGFRSTVYYSDHQDVSSLSYSSREIGLSTTVFRNIFVPNLYGAVGLNWRRKEIYNTSTRYTPQSIIDSEGVSTTWSTDLSMYYNSLNNNLYPSSGKSVGMRYTYTGGVLGGDENYQEIFAYASNYYTFMEYFTLNTSTNQSTLLPLNNNVIPGEARYFRGGIGSIRGFSPNSIAIHADDGIIGGDNFFVFSQELIASINKEGYIQAVAFYDGGYMFNVVGKQYNEGILQSVGVGLRFRTPAGLFRLEFGHKLTPYKYDTATGLVHFGIGNVAF